MTNEGANYLVVSGRDSTVFSSLKTPDIGQVWGHQLLEATGTLFVSESDDRSIDQPASGLLSIYMTHGILILRLYALYGSKMLLYGLLTFMCFSFVATTYVIVRLTPDFTNIDLGPNVGHTCAPTNSADKVSFIWSVRT